MVQNDSRDRDEISKVDSIENEAAPSANKKPSRKTRATCVKLSDEEYEAVKDMEKKTGQSVPTLLRKALLSKNELRQPLFSVDEVKAIITELNRQGNNLNQIARKVNEGSFSGWSLEVNKMVLAWMELRNLIKERYGNN